MSISRKDLFLALAKDVPDPKAEGKTIPNPYKTWKDINSSLPDNKIEVMGPPPTSGTRDAFVELVMDEGCVEFPAIKALKKSDENAFKAICQTLREDGAYIEAGENDNLIVQKLEANPNAFGIFGFSFLDQNSDMIQGSKIEDKQPTFEAIAAGDYPVSRPLFFYVKKAHVGTVPGMEEYLAEFTSEKAWGEEGYLADKGLIPMPADERKKFAEDAKKLNTLSLK
jgi:phosphate transport system substrate-binding protein